MATTPRAGIINLNFKDVSEMAKNIADNDPWKTGIEAAGKVLTDRERYIMYQRALADAQGKERPEDKTIGDLVSGAGKKIGEGAGWLKDKWDRLDIRSPFEEKLSESTKTPITETPSERGSREMIGYAPNQSPIETDKYRTNLKAPAMADVEPNDEVSFGFNQDVGQGEEKASPIIPFATGEQTPEQIGVKVDYGTSEPKTDYTKLRSPFAMREKAEESEAVAPEKAQESGSPFEATEVAETKIKAPRMSEMEAWSEMNRLDPQRAAFDWNRIAPKGSGAAGTVQLRLEHDSKIDQEIAAEAAALRKDMIANGWTSSSPEFLDRYATIMDLEAQKLVKSTKNELTKLIGLSDKELAQGQAKTKAELDAKKQQADAEYKLQQQDMDAFKIVRDMSTDTFAKAKDVPVQINKVQGLLAEGIENNNPKAIDAAAKILIQSFDNSAVLGNEIGMLANTSLVGMFNSLINKIANGTTYTKEDVKNLWAMAEALKTENDKVFAEASKRAQTTYKALRGKESPALDVAFGAYKSLPTTLNPNFDKLPPSFTAQWGKANLETNYDKKTTPSVGNGDSRHEAGSDLN